MLEYTDAVGTVIVFSPNILETFKKKLDRAHGINLNGTYNKLNRVEENYRYTIPGGKEIIGMTFVHRKGIRYIVTSDTIRMGGELTSHALSWLTNTLPNIKLRINEAEVRTPIRADGNNIVDGSGTNYGVNIKDNSTAYLQKFMGWIKKDNGRMINPIIGKFFPMVKLFNADAEKFTGFANIDAYLTRVGHPSIFEGSGSGVLNIRKTGDVFLKVTSVESGSISCELNGLKISDVTDVEKPTPYVLVSIKPVTVYGARLPFFTANYGGVPLFVSMLVMNDDRYLRDMRGGVDLLK